MIRGCTTLELKSGTLTETKQSHVMSLSSVLSPFILQMGLIIYVGLLLLIPKVLSLPSCSELIPMLHSTTGLIAESVEHSPLHQLKASHGWVFNF